MEEIQDKRVIIPITEYSLKVKGQWVTVKLDKPVCMSEILRRFGYLKKESGNE